MIPKLKQKLIKQDKIEVSNDKKIESIETNMKFRMSTLSSYFFRPQYYLSLVKDQEAFQTLVKPYLLQQNKIKNQQKTPDELIEKIFRQLSVCTMFFQRANFLIQRQPLLKVMQIDIRTVKNELGQNKEFLEQYDELDTEEENKEWEDKIQGVQKMDGDQVLTQLKKMRATLNLTPDQHIFVTSNDAQDVAEVLIKQGWHQIQDVFSQVFELKFCLKKRYLYLGPNLQDHQVINHFPQSKALTAKFGLSRSMRNCFQVCQVDQNQFFPRCYDLKDEQDFEDFLEDFKNTLAESILKKYDQKLQYSKYDVVRLSVALEVTKRRIQPIRQKIDQIVQNNVFPIVYPDEWLILRSTKEENVDPVIIAKFMKKQIDDLSEDVYDFKKLKIVATLLKYKQWDPQSYISIGLNIWVIKPCGLSRGRGVKYFTDLEELLPYVACSPKVDFVAQKGIENLLIINQKKFDIRQWVLVSSLSPLKIWIYDECYVRFCAEDYTIEDLKNKFAHLTNNSVAKKSEQFDKDNQGNMWFQKELQEYLIQLTGEDIYGLKIKPDIVKIVINTIRSTAKSIENRKNTFDIYGFDLLIDDSFQSWLIEVNASPTMEKSTAITEQLVSMMLHDTGEFIVDIMYGKKNVNKVGLWTCIYKE